MELVCVGDNVADYYPGKNMLYPGGSAFNVAVLAGRYGLQTGYVGILGNDIAGKHQLNVLKKEGVDSFHVTIKEGKNAISEIINRKGESEVIKVDKGIYNQFSLTEEDLNYIQDFKCLHSTIYSYTEEYLSDFKESGLVISFDYSFKVNSLDDYLRKTVPFVDIAFFSDENSETNLKEFMLSVSKLGPEYVIVTRGERGVLALYKGNYYYQSAPQVDIIDTLGAGDAFIAMFLNCLIKDLPLDRVLKKSNYKAAECCKNHGAIGYGIEMGNNFHHKFLLNRKGVNMPEITSIGKVKNKFKEPTKLEEIRQQESIIVIKPEYEEGLYRIEDNNYLQVIFNFHLSEGYKLKSARRHGKVRGVFASRSPHRPGQVGVTTVKLIEREGRKLRVKGLDAIDGTPVLDIKPYAPFMDEAETFSKDDLKYNPRSEIEHLIKTNNLEELLLRAGQIHGHFCPGLATGVKATTYGLNEIGLESEGMEDVLAIVETNSCFSDGIQYVTGCTFGNNALIYRDFGKTAVTITGREGKGIRLRQRNNNILEEKYPEANQLFQKVVVRREGTEKDRKLLTRKWSDIAFDIVNLPVGKLFKMEKVTPEIPEYAPIFKDEFCAKCGEKIMAPKAVQKDNKSFCKPCANSEYLQLDGSGLKEVDPS